MAAPGQGLGCGFAELCYAWSISVWGQALYKPEGALPSLQCTQDLTSGDCQTRLSHFLPLEGAQDGTEP